MTFALSTEIQEILTRRSSEKSPSAAAANMALPLTWSTVTRGTVKMKVIVTAYGAGADEGRAVGLALAEELVVIVCPADAV